VRPAGALAAPDKAKQQAMRARDRLWTLFARTWETHVWRAGAWLFGREVEHRIPLLGTSRRARKHPLHVTASTSPSASH